MSDSAAHLGDEVLLEVPIRQWFFSLPWHLRHATGYDAKLCSAILAAFRVVILARNPLNPEDSHFVGRST